MLQTIKIKNFALIENAEIPFGEGLNILSGETGAGKSIILGAISLLLGGRANSEVIRTGADEAVVEGFFSIEALPWLKARLAEFGIEATHGELLIKRIVHRNGKNRIFINGELATLNMLVDICEDLVDLCGQNEHQSLFKSNVQLSLLDRFAGLDSQKIKARTQFKVAIDLRDEWELLKRKEDERVQRLEFVQFQIQELNEANLISNEDEALQAEKKLLQSSEQRTQLANQIDGALDGEEGAHSAMKLALSRARALLQVLQVDENAKSLFEALERGVAEVEEASRLARSYLDQSDLSPERLAEVQERLSLITNLKRKYGQTVDEIIAHHAKLIQELDLLTHLSSRLEGLESEYQKEKDSALKLGRDLFQKRKKGAEIFSKAVSKELKELRMADATLELALSFQEDLIQWGADSVGSQIDLLVQTNLGENKKPIQKIVSGGELSRLMLAIRRVIADKGGIGVYLFDEIDAGLGGQTAFTVGKKLKSVASYNQVICITHVPQVACFADHHLSISKSTVKGRTITEVKELNLEGRREEIARMLGAEKLTPSAIKNAKDLMGSARFTLLGMQPT
jgi:DNA repair protein RecN (Recombination protein N)